LPNSFYQSQNVTRKKLRKALSYEKRVRKMLMKLILALTISICGLTIGSNPISGTGVHAMTIDLKYLPTSPPKPEFFNPLSHSG
jgi:hypothetical protein